MNRKLFTIIALVSLICGQVLMTDEAAPPQTSAETATTTASQPAAEVAALRLDVVIQKADSEATGNSVTAIAESHNGKLLAWGDSKGTVRIHSFESNTTAVLQDFTDVDISTRRKIHTILDLAFDENGQLWWRDGGSGIYRADISGKEPQINHVIIASEFVNISSNLLPWGVPSTGPKPAWSLRENLRFFVIETGEIHESAVVFPKINQTVERAVRSPDGKYLMAVSIHDAALLSLPDMKIIRRFGQAAGESAAFSPSSGRVALGASGYGVFVWETETGKLIKKIPLERSRSIHSLVFVGEDTVYTATYPVYRIDTRNGTADAMAETYQADAARILLSRSGDRLFMGTHKGGLVIYALPPKDVQSKDNQSKQPTSLSTS